jgi:hypothetical protein
MRKGNAVSNLSYHPSPSVLEQEGNWPRERDVADLDAGKPLSDEECWPQDTRIVSLNDAMKFEVKCQVNRRNAASLYEWASS